MKRGTRGKYSWIAWTSEDALELKPSQVLVYERLADDPESVKIYLQEDNMGAIADEVDVTQVLDSSIKSLLASDWRSAHDNQ